MRLIDISGDDWKLWAGKFKSEVENLLAGVNDPSYLIRDVGDIYWHAGYLLPKESLECNGQVVRRKAYPELAKKIDTKYNVGSVPLDSVMLPNLVAFTPPGIYCLIRAVGKIGVVTPQGPEGTNVP